MGYRTITAMMQGSADAPRVLDCAIDLARTFGAHIIGVHSEPAPVAYATGVGFPDTAFLATVAEESRKRTGAILDLFRSRTDTAGVSAEWYGSDGFSGDDSPAAFSATRASDLIVVQQVDPDSGSASTGEIETLHFESGRPVLLVPYAGTVHGMPIKRVLVAWNGSREAARAIFDALPFLKAAETTEILVIDGEENGSDVKAIEAALGRHGVKAMVAEQASGGLAVGEIIDNRVAETGAGLVVMGAYSASWLKEWLFGGATRTLLKSMPAPTLMSH